MMEFVPLLTAIPRVCPDVLVEVYAFVRLEIVLFEIVAEVEDDERMPVTYWLDAEVEAVDACKLFAMTVLPIVFPLMVFVPLVTCIPAIEWEILVVEPVVVMEPIVLFEIVVIPLLPLPIPNVTPALVDVCVLIAPVVAPLPIVLPVTVPMFTRPDPEW